MNTRTSKAIYVYMSNTFIPFSNRPSVLGRVWVGREGRLAS